MPATRPYRNPIFAADVRELGGCVSVHTDRDRSDGTPVFRVGHISGGGDVAFLSLPLMLEDHASAAARVLAEFVGGAIAPAAKSDAVSTYETSASDLAVRS
jgi:hypothetical protein